MSLPPRQVGDYDSLEGYPHWVITPDLEHLCREAAVVVTGAKQEGFFAKYKLRMGLL